MTDPAVAFRGVAHTWPGAARPVIEPLDLDVAPGSLVAIVGPSGCGKSTLLRMAAGLVVPTRGQVEVEGRDVAGRPGACAWMPQRDALLPWRRTLANVTLAASVAGRRTAEVDARARALLDRFGLGDQAATWPWQLSGGMRQRVAVLRTFLVPRSVVLLDEPFGALDALTRRQVQHWLLEVWASEGGDAGGRTGLLVTHDVDEAVLLADRVVVLSAAPARVVLDAVVPAGRPRPHDVADDPSLLALRRELLSALGA